MPRGPKGEKRPADVVGAAIKVAKIAIGEIEEDTAEPQSAAAELGRKGGKARAEKMTPAQRADAARKAAAKRWAKSSGSGSN
jgi:hypothetical protein